MKKIIFLLTMLVFLAGMAQNKPEEHLLKAKKWSEVKLYDQALKAIGKGLEEFPEDHDLKSYKIRILLWQKDFDRADNKIESLLNDYPNDYETLQLKATSYWWSNNWIRLKETSRSSLVHYPNDPFFQEKEIIALWELKEYKEASKRFSTIDVASSLSTRLALISKLYNHQRVGIDFIYSHFNNTFSPWSVIRASYHNEAKHSWSLGVSHGNMFSQNGVSFDGAFYPSFGKTFRAVIDLGGSDSEIFPEYRAGAELIADVRKLEFRAGSRIMSFKFSENQIFIHTAGMGIYKGDYYANYKAYLAQLDNRSNDLTHTFLIRRNFSNRFHYIQINASRGTTPLQVSNFSEISRLEATTVRVSYHTLFKEKFMLNASVGFQEEKYLSGNRTRTDGSIGVSMMF
ncbi:MAG: YaiO family outer membrane beta-barrel protein [Ekhidna sp.]